MKIIEKYVMIGKEGSVIIYELEGKRYLAESIVVGGKPILEPIQQIDFEAMRKETFKNSSRQPRDNN